MLIKTRELYKLCESAAHRVGADRTTAKLLASATVHAEENGKPAVGVTHFLDYLIALKSGSIDGTASPTTITNGAITQADAHRNIPHRAFQDALKNLSFAAAHSGIGALSISNTFTAGELSYYTEELANRGLIGFAVANSPAVVATGKSNQKTLGTNPLSFAVPLDDRPMIIDQSITQTAFVSIREAARKNEPLPPGWALNLRGEETTDAIEALEGALLPVGFKLANIGLLVEALAGLAGGNWSMDAPSFDKGSLSPAIGVFIIAINPGFFSENYIQRITKLVRVLESEHGVYVPGRQRHLKEIIKIDDELHEQLLHINYPEQNKKSRSNR